MSTRGPFLNRECSLSSAGGTSTRKQHLVSAGCRFHWVRASGPGCTSSVYRGQAVLAACSLDIVDDLFLFVRILDRLHLPVAMIRLGPSSRRTMRGA